MKIWIDLDNTPHVPFFKPIIRELEKRGHTVVLTARDAFQVCELADKMGLNPVKVGHHYGKNRFMKVWGLGWRTLQLLPTFLKHRPDLALSHGSRGQILLSNILRIPTVMIMDYEFAETPWLLRPRWEIVPKVLLEADLQCKHPERVRTYDGIKEDVYAPDFKPDSSLFKLLDLDPKKIIVTVRPPANEAHYHNPESELFFVEFMKRLVVMPDTKAILLPRNKNQEAQIRKDFPDWFTGDKVVVPKEAVDGLNLLWHSDLVVSGGGTMNREAAALGVPVYSIFRGKIGVLDKQLQKDGRMILIEKIEDIHKMIVIQRREKTVTAASNAPRKALGGILDHVEAILKQECE
jgi:predicted glycosyltransferase